jgi:peptidase E
VIIVGGGNTANMLAIWRVHGFDALLREAWEQVTSSPAGAPG